MRRNLALFVVGVCALALAGCKWTGGGWVISDVSTKATFAFTANCDEPGGKIGMLKWSDQEAGVQFQGTVDAVSSAFGNMSVCEVGGLGIASEGPVTLYGHYTGTGKYKNHSGEFWVVVEDNGEGGLSDDDLISLQLDDSGSWNGYSVSPTTIGGGNIQANS